MKTMIESYVTTGQQSWRDFHHQDACLVWMPDGQSDVHVKPSLFSGVNFQLSKEKSLCLFPAWEFDFIKSNTKTSRGLFLKIKSDIISEILHQEDYTPNFQLFRPAFQDRSISSLLQELYNSTNSQNSKNHQTSIISSITHKLLEDEGRAPKCFANKKFSKIYQNIINEYIEDNFEYDLNSSNLAKVIGISISYFEMIFKNTYRISFHKYLIFRKLERSKKMILHGNYSMTEISLMLGFYSPGHFSMTFKRAHGYTPSEYLLSNKTCIK